MARNLIDRLTCVFSPSAPVLPEVRNARALIDAIDRGGLPLNPAKVNAIARGMGLEVSTRAPLNETISRLREALKRT